MLQVARGTATLIKKDIFKNLMWYVLPDSTKQYPLTIERVRKIRTLNHQNIIPDELEAVDVTSTKQKEVEPEFVDVVGHITLKSLEKADRKRRDKTRDQRQGNRPATQGNKQGPTITRQGPAGNKQIEKQPPQGQKPQQQLPKGQQQQRPPQQRPQQQRPNPNKGGQQGQKGNQQQRGQQPGKPNNPGDEKKPEG